LYHILKQLPGVFILSPACAKTLLVFSKNGIMGVTQNNNNLIKKIQ
jgi:hypothetical protein